MLRLLTCVALAVLALAAGCESTATAHLHNGDMALAAKDYDLAVKEYDIALQKAPQSVTPILGKARAYYGKQDWKQARALFEEFLSKTDTDQHTYINERKDAVFYRDRCRQEMGETIEQDPSKIPPPPMGE